jgi:short-chain 2-methylacyl-CoA dehydrogenase
MTSILAVEEIAKVDPAVSVLVDIQNTLINSLLSRLGTEAQKEKYLTMLATSSVS